MSFRGSFSRAAAKSYWARPLWQRTVHLLLLRRERERAAASLQTEGKEREREKRKNCIPGREEKKRRKNQEDGRHFSRFITKLCFASAFNGLPLAR